MKPTALHFNDNDQLSNESGMACQFGDNWGCWIINGVTVDEQIVMHPETQTLKQIGDEQNEEIKRIRIERYGFADYLAEIEAKLIDRRTNDVEGTKELLYKAGDDMTILLCMCPSTGKDFFLEVKNDITTCVEAQDYISGGRASRIISAS